MAKKPVPQGTISAACRVVILQGKEAFLRAEFTAQLREILAQAHGAIDTFTFDGASASAAEVLDECRSFGLLASHKLVIVDNADQLIKEDNRPLFERYAAAPTDGASLVLRAERWYPGKLDAIVAEHGAFIKCDFIAEHQAATWCQRRCERRHDATIDREAAELLVARIGPDLTRLDSELAKLALAAGSGGAVTRALVGELVGFSREEEVWSIQHELLSHAPEQALSCLRYALDVSRHPPTLIAWAMTDLARKLHGYCAATRSGANPASLARDLKLWGPSQALIDQAARRTSPAMAADLLAACVEADAQSKSGIGEPERLLERLALKFAAI